MFNLFVDGIARRDVSEVKEFIGGAVAVTQDWLALNAAANQEVMKGFESLEEAIQLQAKNIKRLEDNLVLVKDSLVLSEDKVVKLDFEIRKLKQLIKED